MFDQDMRYLQASDRWVSDYHLDGDRIVGQSHYDVFPDAPERWKEAHQRVLAGSIERAAEDPSIARMATSSGSSGRPGRGTGRTARSAA